MKKQSTTIFASLGKIQVQTLTTIVKETLASGIEQVQQVRVFTSADLWNIQRQKKGFSQRRFSL